MIYEDEVTQGIRVIEKIKAIKTEFSYDGEFDSALSSVITKYSLSLKQIYKGLKRFEKNEKNKPQVQIVSLDSLLSDETELIEQHEQAFLQDQAADNVIRALER